MTKKFRTLHKAKSSLSLDNEIKGSAAEGHGSVAKGIALRSGCSFGFGALGQMSLLLDMVRYKYLAKGHLCAT